MDTLALLCNLHADGPETLQRLRAAGWDTLAEVERVDVIELDGVLEVGQVRALRFQREARHLRRRLGEDEPAPVAAGERAAAQAAAPPEPVPEPPPAPPKVRLAEPAAPASSAEESVDRAALMNRVRELARRDIVREAAGEVVREVRLAEPTPRPLDRQPANPDRLLHEPTTPPARAAQVPSRLPALRLDLSAGVLRPLPGRRLPGQPVPGGELEQAAREPEVTPTEAPAPPAEPTLEEGTLDGLDAEAVRALADAGITTARALAEADALALSPEAGLDFTRLRRLQFLARRVAATAPEPVERTLEVPAPRDVGPAPRLASPRRPAPPVPRWTPEPPVMEEEPAPELAATEIPRPAPTEPAGGPFELSSAAETLDLETDGNVAGPFA